MVSRYPCMLLTGVSIRGQCSVSAVFQKCLLLFLSDVIDGDFKAVILKDNALHGKDTSVFVYV